MQIEIVNVKDAKELLDIYRPYVEETAITFEYDVPTCKEFEERIIKISEKYPYIKAVENGEIIGYAYASAFKTRRAYDWSVESTIYIRKDYRGKGVGKILYGELERILTKMGILNMNACIAVPKTEDEHLTADSIFFHEKLGFNKVGIFHDSGFKFNTWYDMTWMEKMLGEHKDTQAEVELGDWTKYVN